MNRYLQAISAALWLLWPMTTLATSVTLGETLGGVPAQAWASVFVLSMVSGLVAILQRINKAVRIERHILMTPDTAANSGFLHEMREKLVDHQVPEPWLTFVLWHMAGAVLMGMISFFFLEAANVNDFLEAVAIALSSYGGAKLVDRVGDTFASKVVQSMQTDKTS